jgi:hypothetical protein
MRCAKKMIVFLAVAADWRSDTLATGGAKFKEFA